MVSPKPLFAYKITHASEYQFLHKNLQCISKNYDISLVFWNSDFGEMKLFKYVVVAGNINGFSDWIFILIQNGHFWEYVTVSENQRYFANEHVLQSCTNTNPLSLSIALTLYKLNIIFWFLNIISLSQH